ncbi:unnamed protein product, partial [Ectocarpus sp. 13 AM-2016]
KTPRWPSCRTFSSTDGMAQATMGGLVSTDGSPLRGTGAPFCPRSLSRRSSTSPGSTALTGGGVAGSENSDPF